MEKSLKGVLVDVINDKVEEHEIDHNNYKAFYPVLNCDCFDIVTRKIGKHYYDIYCDDEGLFKEDNPVAIVTESKYGEVVEQIVGNCFICKSDDEGNSISLTPKEITEVLGQVVAILNLETGVHHKGLKASI